MNLKANDYKRLIESGFDIISKTGERMPFILNDVQNDFLITYLGEKYTDMQGIRENVAKARQEGFSAIIDAVFAVDFLVQDNVGSQIISHKEKETQILLDRTNFYIDSFLEKNNIPRSALLETDRKDYLQNRQNGSYIFIGTAGAKTLGRGGTLQNIHWSEPAFYPNTEILNAEKLVTAAEQQVLMGTGKIFRESTGNVVGDFFQTEVERSRLGDSSFGYYFCPWYKHDEYRTEERFELKDAEIELYQELSTIESRLTDDQIYWFIKKMREFKSLALGRREYPTIIDDAFLAGGESIFDKDILRAWYVKAKEPVQVGSLGMDGEWF